MKTLEQLMGSKLRMSNHFEDDKEEQTKYIREYLALDEMKTELEKETKRLEEALTKTQPSDLEWLTLRVKITYLKQLIG